METYLKIWNLWRKSDIDDLDKKMKVRGKRKILGSKECCETLEKIRTFSL